MQKSKMSQGSLIQKSWAKAFDTIFGANKIIIPFIVVALLELIGIAVLFFTIQPPMVKYIAPIVLRFWGQQFLHYPLNLLLLSQFFYYFQIVLAIVVGSFVTGLTISNTLQYSQTEELSYKTSFKKTLFKYVSLLIITVLLFALVRFASVIEGKILIKIMMKGQSFLGIRREDWSILFIFSGVLTAGFVQSLFIFSYPAIIIDNKNFITAIFRNIVFVFKNLFSACFLVIVPLIIYIPVSLLKGNLFKIMNKTSPEIVFTILGFGILASLFINLIITVSTTHAYLLIRGKDND